MNLVYIQSQILIWQIDPERLIIVPAQLKFKLSAPGSYSISFKISPTVTIYISFLNALKANVLVL